MLRLTSRVALASVLAVVASGAAASASAGNGASTLPFAKNAPGTPTFSEQKTNWAHANALQTVPFWTSQFTDPTNGVTYAYSMVGRGDPRIAHGGGTTTVPTVIVPLAFSFAAADGFTLDGSDRVPAVLASPQFQNGDYRAAAPHSNSTGVQLEDATMRSQFDEVGASPYHLMLGMPTVLPTQTLSVPKGQGSALDTPAGPLGLVANDWFLQKLNQLLNTLRLDPATLPIFLVDNSYLYAGKDPNAPGACCVLGFHGAGKLQGSVGTKTPVQTFVFASYVSRGSFSQPFVADIHALSHEVAEWASDPFVNNLVTPWLSQNAPQYGCTDLLETGDPVFGTGFTMPGNSFDTGPFADGSWHPEDEVFLPWFAREAPNRTSEGGRYTFMGDANPLPGFHVPATGC